MATRYQAGALVGIYRQQRERGTLPLALTPLNSLTESELFHHFLQLDQRESRATYTLLLEC